MEDNLHSFGDSLSTFVDKSQPSEAEALISQVNKLFTESELPAFTIDAYLLNIFNKSNGLLKFLNRVLHENEYKKTKLKCFALLYTLVNNCPNKIQNYLIDIIKACSPVVRSSGSAAEKQKSLQLITLIIQKWDLQAVDQAEVDTELSELYNTTLFKCLQCRFDKSDTVQEELLVAIGAITKKVPAAIKNPLELRDTLMNQLNRELNKSNKSFPVITGTVIALTNFLENFPIQGSKVDTIYKYVKMLADPGDASRRVAFRESLSLVSKNTALLSNELYSDAKWWHQTLLKWFGFGAEDKKAAYGVLDAFYLEMANVLSTRNGDADRELFKYFMDYFTQVIATRLTESYEMQLAIRGFGLLARSFRTHITSKEINTTFLTISQILEDTYILNQELNTDEEIMYLPHYIQTLSCITKNLPELTNTHLVCLQRVCVIMIKVFPQISPVQHHIVIDAFVLTLFQLLQCKTNILDTFLEEVVYQGVIWTCSHPIALDAEVYKEHDQQINTYKNYLPLWNGLLSITNSRKYEKYEITSKIRKTIVRKLLDELIKTLFLVINKLNLNTKLKDGDLPITDPESAYEAIQMNDFVIFINVVDFYQDILEKIEQAMLKIWLNVFINQIIIKSIKHPLVSGFYKLLGTGLKVCDNLNYFEDVKLSSNEDLSICYVSVCKFLQEVLWKMKQYKGDLQIACMHVLLATPICIATKILQNAAPAFIALFTIGRSYLELTNLGIDTLLRWLEFIPRNNIEHFLKQVLPSLDMYLQSRSLGGSFATNSTLKVRKTKLAVNKQKILVQTEPELFKLQIKILKLIGQLDNDLSLTFISSGNNVEPVVWNKIPYLKITLPYADMKLNLYIDKFVPRVIELAVHSSDRKIRVAACELLHAFIMILLGTSHSMDSSKLINLDSLVKAVAQPILKLGCDMDQVIRQLYCPLALQLMHYYSHPRQMNSSHTQIIVEILIDGISNPTDSTVRDFAGICIKEFVTWTVKQADQDDLLKNPINIKLWIRTIHSFSIHPDPFKRLGAALIFNNIYTILREETLMFNMFWLEILYALVMNLSFIQVNNVDDNNCVDQVTQALNHVQRGLIEKHQLFNKADTLRRKPLGFEGNLLKDVALWLLKETGSINPYCRHKCMIMFCKIAPLVTNCKNDLQTFNKLYMTNNLEWIALEYEDELLKNPTLNQLNNIEGTIGLFKWMRGLLCALDGYIFVTTNKLIPTNFSSKKSTFFISLQFFLQSVQLQRINEVLNLVRGNENITYTVNEKEDFNNLKRDIVSKIIEYTTAILGNEAELQYITTTPQLLWGNNLWDLLSDGIFDASAAGFDIIKSENHDYMILNLLNKINNYCSLGVLNSLLNSLSTFIIKKLENYTELGPKIISRQQRQLITGILLLEKSVLAEKLNVAKYGAGTVKYLFSSLTENRDEQKIIIKLHKSALNFWSLKLELAQKDKQEFYEMVKFMCNKTKVKNEEQNVELDYGMYFFETFKGTLVKSIFQNYAVFLDHMCKLSAAEITIKYVLEILRYINQNSKRLEQQTIQEVIQLCINNWDRIYNPVDQSITQQLLGIEFISKLSCVTIEPLYNLTQTKPELVHWVISLLNFEDAEWTSEAALSFKSEVLNILPAVVGPFDSYEAELRSALQSFKDKYFSKTNSLNIAVVTAFKKLLEALKGSKSRILLNYTVEIYGTTFYNAKDIDLTNILRLYIRHADVNHQKTALCDIHKLCCDTTKFTNKQRYLVAKAVLPTFVQHCYYSAFEQFYVATIRWILSILNEKHSPSFSMVAIVNKTIAYILVELLFSRIKIENFENNSCAITKAAFSEETSAEKKLHKVLIQNALDVCKVNYNLCNQEEKNTFRLYQCHSYNALVSVISNTQKDSTYYNWLFSRESNKQDILWKNLVDTDKKYSFEVDFDKVPTMKKMLVNIRGDLYANRKDLNPGIHKVKYIESQHLFNSTLSEDITRFDFTNTMLYSKPKDEPIHGNVDRRAEVQVILESIDINEHECMATLCALIQHMVDSDISPLPINDEDISLPKWMKSLRSVMMAKSTTINVKIFLAKLIHNTQHIFKPYAKWFLAPLMKVIVDGCIGYTINFFITDLVVMLSSWSDVAIPNEDTELASALFKFLINNADNDRRDIFKYNLEQIKLIVEVWKSCLAIPYELLFLKFKLDSNSQKLDVGVHLSAILLCNGIAPWHPNEVQTFLMALCKIIKSTHRSVYQPCAEVLGMSLKYMSTEPGSAQQLNQFKNYLQKHLMKMIEDDDKFAYCLQGIAMHHPAIADNYLCRMVSKLNHVHGNFKCIYLKVFLSRIETLQSMNELISLSVNFRKLLTDENMEVQILTLEIIQKSIQYLGTTELVPILNDVSKFVNSSFTICRTVMYDVLTTSYNIHYMQENEASKEITEICKDVLLQGLIDKDLTLQEKIILFWSSTNHLPTDCSKRVLYLLNSMYKANIEEHYVGYSTFLLLNVIKSTEEFDEKIFEHALHECDFQEYKLISNWRRQHASIAPLFADSLRSQESGTTSINPNVLRATVSTLQFQPTQAKNTNLSSNSNYLTHSSSLLFSVDTNSSSEMKDGVFKDPNYVLPKMHGSRSRRFLRDKSKISRHCAYLEVKKSIKAEELRKERIRESERNVNVCRDYRIGDYPDIEITLSSVINPLQMLARCDATLARCLYTSLFTSLLNKMEKEQNQDEVFIENVNLAINNIFNSSTQFIPNTIGTFLDIALTHKNKVYVQPNAITSVCQASGLVSVGSLLLEEYLIASEVDYTTPVKKSRGVIEDNDILLWTKLATLYKEMDEWDVVSTIFLEKMNCNERVLNAIEAESVGHWRPAQDFYATVINEDPSQERKDFYYESYFKCFAALTEWDKLSKVIEETVISDSENNVWTALWDDEWNQQKLLPWYITAELRNTLQGSDRKLFVSINQFLKDAEKLDYLKLHFGEELAMLWLLQNDNEAANYYLHNSMTNFLENWSHLNPLFVKLRANKVFCLQNVIDIYLFLNTINTIKLSNHKTVLGALLKSWKESPCTSMESLVLSETRTVYRNQFISVLRTKLQSILNADDLQATATNLNECEFKLHLNLIESSLLHRNYYVARKYIRASKANTDIEKMQLRLVASRTGYVIAQTCDNNEEKLVKMMKSWTQIGATANSSSNQDNSMCYLIKANEHIYHLTQEVYNIISTNETLFEKNKKKLKELMGSSLLNHPEDMRRFGVTALRNSLEYCENEIQLMMNTDNLNVYDHIASAYVKLAYNVQSKEELENDFILYVLRSMKLGSIEGKQLFPCLLSKDIGIVHKDTFVRESSEIPLWMFLGWLPQLLANLDTSCVFVISDILVKIAKIYPQAIMYAYRLSKQKFTFKSDTIGIYGKEVTQKLDDLLLCDNLIDKFLKAMGFVSPPTNMLNYYMLKLMAACSSKERFNAVLQTLFDEVYSESPDYKNVDSFQGMVFKQIRVYKTKLENIAKGNFDSVKYPTALKTLYEEIKNLKCKKSTRLVDYCPWLTNFQTTNLYASLEIPGQYTGSKRPLVQYHVKIMGFAPTVLPLGSLRAPIRITILGHDAKEYHYLIKFGEDLRQDQRIEQIFNLMNNILSHDSKCHKRQLSIDTYQVGVIEWINNTRKLKEFIENGIYEPEKSSYRKAGMDYNTWIQKAAPRNQKGTPYGYACMKYSQNNTIQTYTALVNTLPLDILRRSFWNISVNSESFYALRHKFATSYGVICISQWLLGIGDRHLENTIISLHSGQAIGIDFGHAFGTATQVLPIPELVPFRLTPHIVHLLQPLGERGLLQETMIHCLRAYRNSHDILLATMNVFIKEPSLDWLEFARRSEASSGFALKQEWYPNQKILHAEQKLQGANSASIMIEELKAGHSQTPFLEAYINLVKGIPGHNFRAQKGDTLSVEDQVKCLLDHGTDYNLLGRMYAGWEPWI